MLAVSPFFGALLRGICKISGMDPFLSPSGYCCGHWSRNNGGVCLAFNLTTLDISKWLQELFRPTLLNRGRLPPARAVRLTSTRAARCACFRTPWSIYTFLHHSKHLSPYSELRTKWPPAAWAAQPSTYRGRRELPSLPWNEKDTASW